MRYKRAAEKLGADPLEVVHVVGVVRPPPDEAALAPPEERHFGDLRRLTPGPVGERLQRSKAAWTSWTLSKSDRGRVRQPPVFPGRALPAPRHNYRRPVGVSLAFIETTCNT
jgi:hypothetical protein